MMGSQSLMTYKRETGRFRLKLVRVKLDRKRSSEIVQTLPKPYKQRSGFDIPLKKERKC